MLCGASLEVPIIWYLDILYYYAFLQKNNYGCHRTIVNVGPGNPRRHTRTTPCCTPSLEQARCPAERLLNDGKQTSCFRTYHRYHHKIHLLSRLRDSSANIVVDTIPPSSTPTDWRGNHTNENTVGSPRHQTWQSYEGLSHS